MTSVHFLRKRKSIITMTFLYFLVIRCPQPKKEENLVYIDYDLLKMNHLTLLIWMMNASSLLFVCDCWAATSTTMSSAEMATEDTRAEVIKDSSSTSSSAAAEASVERKCFVCYSCKRVETSQSVPCSEDEDQCMVRLVYVLLLPERGCRLNERVGFHHFG